MKNKNSLTPDDVEIIPLTNTEDISQFSCSEKQLNAFLREDALNDQANLYSITRIVKYNEKVVGFFTLIADNINIASLDKNQIEDIYADYHYAKLPAVKIARLATDEHYERLGIGRIMLIQIFHLVDQISFIAGCRVITVDAKRDAVDFYKKFAFHEVSSKRDAPYIPMYLDFKILRDGF